MTYFHIDSTDDIFGKQLLAAGESINTFDRPANPYYTRVCDIHHELGNRRRRLLEYFGSADASDESSQKLASGARSILKGYIRLVREMEFENVRRERFPKLPSRTRCIWLDTSELHARHWLKRVEKDGPLQILEVEIEGALHRADSAHLAYDSSSVQELRAAAERYWSGVSHANPEPEYLFEGRMTVVRVVK